MSLLRTFFFVAFHIFGVDMLETLLTPRSSICPTKNYTCVVTAGVEIRWLTNTTNRRELQHFFTNRQDAYFEEGGFQVTFMPRGGGNFTSSLHVQDLDLNGTNLTCEGVDSDVNMDDSETKNDTITICVTGPASPPTNMSVVWDPPSVVVSFQSPVYGGECVDYYVVTAVSEERNVSCNITSYSREHSCSVSLDGSANNYHFTVHSVTPVNNSFFYKGDNISDCCLSFPKNITAVEERCGHINVSWESSHNITSVNTTISWIGVSGAMRHYDRVVSEDSHLLTLDYSETGPVEISVTFSSHLCSKTTVITYLVEGVLTSVYLRSRTLVIESRDCISSPQNYRIIITTPPAMMNVSFNTTVEHYLEDVSPGTTVTVQLVETTSNTIIDERNYTIPYPTPTRTPTVTPTEPFVVGGAKPERGSAVIPIAAGVGGGGVAVLLVVPVTLCLVVWVVRNRRPKHAINVKGEELKILGSPQVSVEEGKRSCDPPQTPAPAVPDSVSRPDVVPSLYAELDTLSRQKKEEPAAIPMYHVLEGPTPVDKSKKKKNRGSKSSATITEKEEEEEKEKEEEEEKEKEEVTSI